MKAATRMSTPPMVGVPCFALWRSGPTSRMFCPMPRRCSQRMKRRSRQHAMTTATSGGCQDL